VRGKLQLPQVIGLDDCEEVARGHLVERNEKLQLAAHVSVLLQGHKTRGIVRGSHVVKKSAVRQFEASPRVHDDFSGGLLAGNFFDRTKRPRHVEHLADFCFADMQGHPVVLHPRPEVQRQIVSFSEHRLPRRWFSALGSYARSEEHTSELQSLAYLVCRLLLEKKNDPASNLF